MSWGPDVGLLRLALLVVGGRRFWLLPLLPLLWLLFQAGVLLIAGGGEGFGPAAAQGALIGLTADAAGCLPRYPHHCW